MTVRFFPGSRQQKTSLVAGFLRQFQVDHELVKPETYHSNTFHFGTDPAVEVDVRSAVAVDGAAVSPKELQMAVSLIQNLSDRFDPQRYHDEYQAALKQVIDAKVEGAPLPALQTEQSEKVVDLMEALRASVEATHKKSSGQTDGEAPATRTRTISSRRRKSA